MHISFQPARTPSPAPGVDLPELQNTAVLRRLRRRVSQQDYQAIIAEVRRFLSGEIDQIARLTQEQMERAAESLGL